MNKQDYDIIEIDHWECPDDPVAILAMPNIPYPLFGLAPRTVLGNSTWNFMRKKCYMDAGYKCEICGKEGMQPQAHEIYNIDYATQTATFARCVCLDECCHLRGIHTGRALTLYKQGNPIYTKQRLLEGAEHAFTIISSYNEAHKGEEPLRLFSAWLDYLKQPELKEEMEKLIKKYDIKFYKVSDKWWNKKRWSSWKLIVGNRSYPTLYADRKEMEQKMAEKNGSYGDDHNIKNPFKGDIYKEIQKLLDSQK